MTFCPNSLRAKELWDSLSRLAFSGDFHPKRFGGDLLSLSLRYAIAFLSISGSSLNAPSPVLHLLHVSPPIAPVSWQCSTTNGSGGRPFLGSLRVGRISSSCRPQIKQQYSCSLRIRLYSTKLIPYFLRRWPSRSYSLRSVGVRSLYLFLPMTLLYHRAP